jgi:hypothetical protein
MSDGIDWEDEVDSYRRSNVRLSIVLDSKSMPSPFKSSSMSDESFSESPRHKVGGGDSSDEEAEDVKNASILTPGINGGPDLDEEDQEEWLASWEEYRSVVNPDRVLFYHPKSSLANKGSIPHSLDRARELLKKGMAAFKDDDDDLVQ